MVREYGVAVSPPDLFLPDPQCSALEHPGEQNLGGVMGQGGSAMRCEAGASTEHWGAPTAIHPIISFSVLNVAFFSPLMRPQDGNGVPPTPKQFWGGHRGSSGCWSSVANERDQH